MKETPSNVNAGRAPAVNCAAIANIAALFQGVNQALARPDHQPGGVAFFGRSGLGKTTALAWCCGRARGYYVSCSSVDTKKSFLLKLATQMSLLPARTTPELLEQTAAQLFASKRPLFVDEFDHLAAKNAAEIVRDLMDSAHATVILVGESSLPKKLHRWERLHNRIGQWLEAQPSSLDDCKKLAEFYAPNVSIEPELLARLQGVHSGVAVRICNDLEDIKHYCASRALKSISLAEWEKRRDKHLQVIK